MTKLSGPMVPPKTGGAPAQLVVLLHGYGSDGQDLIGLATQWRDLLPNGLFVAPNAPAPCRDNPGGYQWFAIDHDRADYRFEGASAGAPVIVEFLDDLWAQTGLTARDTILAGFSQGAMMALHVGLSLPDRLMGILAFSGALIPPAAFLDGSGSTPPVCLVHGDRDQVVDVGLSTQAAAMLRDRGIDVQFHVEPGVGHGIAPDGLEFAGRFIAAVSATV